MVTPAPLTNVPITSTNQNFKILNNFKRKVEENVSLAIAKKTTETIMSTPVQTKTDTEKVNNQTKSTTFRIPKVTRPNDNETSNCSPTQQTTNDSNNQQGKRKFSLSQYQEHKKLKSTESPVNYSGDVDMRVLPNEINRNTSPKSVNDNSPITSPKTNDNSKDLVLKSNLSEPGVKKINKKKVIWADEKDQALVHTSIFEIDVSEKVDMHAFARQCANNISLAQIEKLMERDLRNRQGLQDSNVNKLDERLNLPPLPRLIRILLPDTINIPTVKSQERFAQEEREKTVLQAFSFRSFLPDTPGEPDCELNGNSSLNDAKLIPFDDVNAKTTPNEVSSVIDTPTTTTTTTTPAPIAAPGLSSLSLEKLSPEVAKILAQAQVNVSTTTTTNSLPTTTVNTSMSQTTPLTSTSSVLPSTPNLLSTILNLTRPNGIDSATSTKIDALLDKIQLNPLVTPPANPIINPVPTLPLNFSLPTAPNPLAINQLLAQAFVLGLAPPLPATFNNPMFPLPINSNPAPTTITTTANNLMSTPRFSSPSVGQQSPRFKNNQHNTDRHPMHNTRGNHRGRGFRRGGHNNTNRRDFVPNRNNNHNRNMFT